DVSKSQVEYVFITDSGKADLTNMNDPTQKITWKDTSGNINMNTVDKYDDVYAKAHFDPFTLSGGDFRATINLTFEGGRSARIDLNIEKNYGAAKLQSTSWDTFFNEGFQTKYTLTADELNSIKENGVDFTIVRKGSHVYILLNDVIKFDFELTEKDGFNYATAKAGLNIQYCQDQERDKNHGLTLDVRGTIPEEIADKIAEKESAA
ncbi:MAG: hypothetical protein K2L54_01400, partial [Clostridiales bacterium]|nr:hypothetical protein [Clostridiales bacterium]